MTWVDRMRWSLFGALHTRRPLWLPMAPVTQMACTKAEVCSRMTAGLRALHGRTTT